MLVTMVENELEEKKIKFPCLRIDDACGNVWLFRREDHAILLWTPTGADVGLRFPNMKIEGTKPFVGRVIFKEE